MQSLNRIFYLDVLRGFAVLGILVMNIPDFAIPSWNVENPALFNGIDSLSYKAWQFCYIFLDGKMRGILSLLFGVSILLITSAEYDGKGLTTPKLYYCRMFWLLIFALFTSYIMLSFTGILYEYAICGMVIYFFRKLNYKWLLSIGTICLIIFSWGMGQSFKSVKEKKEAYNLAMSHIKSGQKADSSDIKAINAWNKRQKENMEGMGEAAESYITEYRLAHSDYGSIFLMSADELTEEFTLDFIGGFWETFGTILIGMGLFKTRFLRGRMKDRSYLLLAILLIVSGTIIGYIRSVIQTGADNDFTGSYIDTRNFSVYHTQQFHRLSLMLGYVSLFIYFCKKNMLGFVLKTLQTVGKMAISNYIFQNFCCSLIFFGYGLNMYGTLERYQLFYVIACIWAVQITFSIIWLKYYTIGPVEWLWRSLIYWKKMPLKQVDTGA